MVDPYRPSVRKVYTRKDLLWMKDAACLGYPQEFFFAEEDNEREDNLPGLLICAECPVQAQCLEYALNLNIKFGVFGGVTAHARQQIRRERGWVGT